MMDWKAIALGAVTVCASISGAAFFAGHRDQSVADFERRITKLEVMGEDQAKVNSQLSLQLARIEEQLKFIGERLAGPKK